MPEFKIIVTSEYTATYYVEADHWKQAEDMVTSNTIVPDLQDFEGTEVKVEEVEDESP